jgi:hypothetical protein
MKKLLQQYSQLSSEARRAFWLSLILSAFMLAFGLLLVADLHEQNGFAWILANILPLIVSAFCAVSTGLILSGRKEAAGYVLIVTVFVSMLIVPVLSGGYAFTAAMITLLVPAFIGSQTLSARVAGRLNLVGLLVAMIILLLDAFWPWLRIEAEASDISASRILAFVLLGIYLLLLLRQFRSFPLRTKLIIASLALTLLPMISVSQISSQASQAALEKNASQSLVSSAYQVSASLDSFVLYNLDALRTEAKMGAIVEYLESAPASRAGSALERDVTEMLTAFQQKDPLYITSYALLDSRGVTLLDTEEDEIGLTKSDRTYFTETVRTGLPYVSSIAYSPVNGQASLYFTAPVRNPLGEIIGVIRSRYNADILQQKIVQKEQYYGLSATAMLIDENKLFLAHSSEPEYILKSFVPLTENNAAELRSRMVLPNLPLDQLYVDVPGLANNLSFEKTEMHFVGEIHFEKHQGSQNDYAGAVRMQTRPWYVVISQPSTVLLAPVEILARNTLAFGVVATLIAVTFSVIIAQFLTNHSRYLRKLQINLRQGIWACAPM